ncbi:methyltransferase domain-containing protein [Motiliproteus coralliicola]|uniref:Methyltransferase domain-containing protein n=1 Tax=Motiliproteus coralliicola TaxID=2283196 RepID=A0A369WBZ4_9GAMM|nr:methyltransferase domain-containing protein [Motiliproteus coralliicola]
MDSQAHNSLGCPLCGQPLAATPSGVACVNNHSFDRARQGYLNLLPVQNKRSRAPGDDAAMVNNRRNFLQLGHYQALSDAINHQLLSHLKSGESVNILDSGCGEGYYSTRLQQALEQQLSPLISAIDISKPAIRAACQRSKMIQWLVASSRQIPLLPASQDAILCLFAPTSRDSFASTLKPGGLLLVATTGEDHLIELRELIYPEVKRRFFDPTDSLQPAFEPIETQQVQYRFKLDNNQTILQLLAMTPHQWRTDEAARLRLQQIEQLELTLDVRLQLYRNSNDQSPRADATL